MRTRYRNTFYISISDGRKRHKAQNVKEVFDYLQTLGSNFTYQNATGHFMNLRSKIALYRCLKDSLTLELKMFPKKKSEILTVQITKHE